MNSISNKKDHPVEYLEQLIGTIERAYSYLLTRDINRIGLVKLHKNVIDLRDDLITQSGEYSDGSEYINRDTADKY